MVINHHGIVENENAYSILDLIEDYVTNYITYFANLLVVTPHETHTQYLLRIEDCTESAANKKLMACMFACFICSFVCVEFEMCLDSDLKSCFICSFVCVEFELCPDSDLK